MDFGDLKDDKEIQSKLLKFHGNVDSIEKILNDILTEDSFEKLTSEKEKVDYDLFVAYTLNTLYWMYLRSKGEDPNVNEVRNQLARVKNYMVKAQKAHERNTIRPTINVPVAARFIKHGVKHKKSLEEQSPNKKTKTSD